MRKEWLAQRVVALGLSDGPTQGSEAREKSCDVGELHAV
jgi:hypothetical protein